MHATYFPFTCISDRSAGQITRLFPKLTVYAPAEKSIPDHLSQLSKNGMIDIRIPIRQDDDRLKAAFSEYLEWGRTHKGSTIASLKHRSDSPFLYDDSWSAQIKSDIQNLSAKTPPSQDNAAFAARLFLQIAQEFDRHQHEMLQDIQSIEDMENSLLQELQANENPAFQTNAESLSPSYQDLGIYMTKERLTSWSTLFTHDPKCASGIFITDSRGVWEYLLEFSPEAEYIENRIPLSISGGALHESTRLLLDSLPQLQTEEWSLKESDSAPEKSLDRSGNEKTLTLVIIPDISPAAFFSRFAPHSRKHPDQEADAFRNTIIGITE